MDGQNQNQPAEDYQPESQAAETGSLPEPRKEPLPVEYYKDKGRAKRLMAILLAIAVVAAIAGAYWFKFRGQPAAGPAKSTAGNTPSQASGGTFGQISTATKHYDSSNFGLGLDYPSDWTVADTTGKLTVTSPAIQLPAASGQNTSGKITLIITQKGQNLSDFAGGNATAVLDSEKVAYTNPTQTQRGNTYLSFLQYAKTSASGALDGVYITGDFGYQRGQAIPKTDIAKIDPEIALVFSDSSSQPLSIASSSWNAPGFSGPLKKMLTSLAIN